MSLYDTDDFQHDVLERSETVPVVVDFWAEWCGPCRVLGPILESLAADAGDRWVLAKVDTDRHPEVAGQYGIRGIPAVKLFVDGEVVDEFVGALPEPAVRDWLEGALPTPSARRVARARGLLESGDRDAAVEILREVLAGDAVPTEARVLLASAIVFEDPDGARALVEPVSMGSEHADRADAITTLADLLDRLRDPADLPDDDVKPTYLDAIAALQRRDWPRALDGFIDVLRRRRAYDGDGARRACLAIFQYLGPEDPVTREHRPAFGNAVYA